MPELLSFLITVILVLYIVRKVAQILLPMLFQGAVNKAQQQNYSNQQQYRAKSNNAAPKIKVDYAPKNKGTVPDSEGEFIDYEEIK